MISDEERQQLKASGYTDEEINQAVAKATSQNTGVNSMFQQAPNDNLIKWQLEVDKLLERIDHILKGDKPKFDKEHNLIWEECKDHNKRLFNEDGVDELMRLLSMYINRNTILSNYKEEVINDKVYDLGVDLSNLIYMKYDVFGLDTEDKRKHYPIIVRQVIDMVHSSYLRALNGEEKKSLREARQIAQQEILTGATPQVQTKGSRFHFFNKLGK